MLGRRAHQTKARQDSREGVFEAAVARARSRRGVEVASRASWTRDPGEEGNDGAVAPVAGEPHGRRARGLWHPPGGVSPDFRREPANHCRGAGRVERSRAVLAGGRQENRPDDHGLARSSLNLNSARGAVTAHGPSRRHGHAEAHGVLLHFPALRALRARGTQRQSAATGFIGNCCGQKNSDSDEPPFRRCFHCRPPPGMLLKGRSAPCEWAQEPGARNFGKRCGVKPQKSTPERPPGVRLNFLQATSGRGCRREWQRHDRAARQAQRVQARGGA